MPQEFRDTDEFRGARFVGTDLSGAEFREVNLNGARMIGVEMADAEIDGLVSGLVVNGVDVMPLVAAELDRRHPERVLMRSADPAQLHQVWLLLDDMWSAAIDRARALPEARRHERVAGEWSFAETLRHLIFVTDSWFSRTIAVDPAPFHPGGLPPDFVPDVLEMGIERDAQPPFEHVVDVWQARGSIVVGYLEAVTADELAMTCAENPTVGWPPHTNRFTVLYCLHVILDEVWAHHQFAARDLAVLEAT